MTLSRRSLITGLVSLVASPAIVRASSLMPVKAFDPEWVDPRILEAFWRQPLIMPLNAPKPELAEPLDHLREEIYRATAIPPELMVSQS